MISMTMQKATTLLCMTRLSHTSIFWVEGAYKGSCSVLVIELLLHFCYYRARFYRSRRKNNPFALFASSLAAHKNAPLTPRSVHKAGQQIFTSVEEKVKGKRCYILMLQQRWEKMQDVANILTVRVKIGWCISCPTGFGRKTFFYCVAVYSGIYSCFSSSFP